MGKYDNPFEDAKQMKEGAEQLAQQPEGAGEPQPGTEAWKKKQLEETMKRLAAEDTNEEPEFDLTEK